MLCGQRHHPEVRVHLPREARLPLSSTPSSHPSLPSIYVILIPIVSSGIEEPRQGYAFVWYFSVGDSSLLGCHPTGWCLSLKLSIILIYLDIFIFTINNPPPPPLSLAAGLLPIHRRSSPASLSLSLSFAALLFFRLDPLFRLLCEIQCAMLITVQCVSLRRDCRVQEIRTRVKKISTLGFHPWICTKILTHSSKHRYASFCQVRVEATDQTLQQCLT